MNLNYWDYHGWLFLIGITFLPRITMLFFTSVTFGFWAILGWIFTPHLLAAIYATTFYWNKNPVLCVIAWLMAFAGTGGEAKLAQRASSRKRIRNS